MAELTDAQKTEIVELLAQLRSPIEIIRHFRVEYGIEVPTRQVTSYDPRKAHYDAGEKWRDLFEARYAQYLKNVEEVPAANQGFRLSLLQEGIMAARRRSDWPLVAQLLEQAAKEVGGVLTNQRELRVDDNRRQNPRLMTPEDRQAMMEQVIAEAMAQREAEKQGKTLQ